MVMSTMRIAPVGMVLPEQRDGHVAAGQALAHDS
jgi:hypothetical protein